MNSIEKPIYELLQKEPFFANFILGATILFDTKGIERAACRIYRDEVQFMFNTQWMASITVSEQCAVFKHEIFHILLDHTGKRGGPRVNHLAKNYAMDCAINQHIEGLPADGVTLASMEKLCGKKLLPFETWEYYYAQIKEKAKENGKKHDHDAMEGGGEGDMTIEDDSEAGMARRQAAVKDLANKAVKASAGNVSQTIADLLGALNKAAKVNWQQQLRNLVASSRAVERIGTRKRPHRRYSYEQPGSKKKRQLILGVCVDSSGSVSNEAFSAFMTEIYYIAQNTTITYLIHADCEVQKVDVIKGGKPGKDVLNKRHGNGGTAYQPAIDECVKRDCDAILYFGDFDCADVPKNPGVSFIWVGVGQSPPPGNFGKVIRLDF